jgi:hypothetical protein
MSMTIRVDSEVTLGGKLHRSFSEAEVKNEPMLFNCDREHASRLGGPLTRAFLEFLPESWLHAHDFVVDSRVHMLMPGWFPAIPGYHHDDVPRSTVDGQPNYLAPEYRSQHVMMLVNAAVCPTEFAVGSMDFELPEIGELVYKRWHPQVEIAVAQGRLHLERVPDRTLAYFNDRTWHQATPAVSNGWRWFVRASRSTGRKPTNELRRQVQVYLANPMEGW